MANYIVSYDLNGSRPTHAEMDKHMGEAGWAHVRFAERSPTLGISCFQCRNGFAWLRATAAMPPAWPRPALSDRPSSSRAPLGVA